ncbi:MAG: hypothetical protein GY862_35090 [Gammaproteobacteria bacterium]|nr:hypothetical protein [Gammaproteobacteria bacterium]
MSLELNLRFPEPHLLIVRYEEEETATLAFESPLNQGNRIKITEQSIRCADIQYPMQPYNALI